MKLLILIISNWGQSFCACSKRQIPPAAPPPFFNVG